VTSPHLTLLRVEQIDEQCAERGNQWALCQDWRWSFAALAAMPCEQRRYLACEHCGETGCENCNGSGLVPGPDCGSCPTCKARKALEVDRG